MAKNNISDIRIDSNSTETKLQQLINELLREINTQYSKGDILPSVNLLSKRLNISRDTVFKAYRELKRRKIVGSWPTKGYYVECELNKILFMLDYYSPFKDILYREFKNNLDESSTIDLVFHHYNQKLFDSVILESIGRYNYYIIMNIDTQRLEISDSLKKIDPSKLLLLDIPIKNWKKFDKDKYNFVWQNFDESVFEILSKIKDKISKYKVFKLVNTKESQHPGIILEVYARFCENFKIKSQVIKNSAEIIVNPGDGYFVLRQSDLYNILSQCKAKQLEPGKDIGILAYNDFPLYEFVSCGITVITTDFKKMGQMSSKFIKERKSIKEIIPTKLLLRNSL